MGYRFNISMCYHNKPSASITATPGRDFQHNLFPTFYLPSWRVLSILSHTPWLEALCFLKYMCFDIGNSIFPNRDPDILVSVVSWMVTPQKICTHPNPRDLGILPKMAKGVMKWRILRRGAYPGWAGWAPNPITDIPERVRQRGLGHSEKAPWPSAASPAYKYLETPGAGKARNGFSSKASGGSPTLPDTRISNFWCPERWENLLLSFVLNHPICRNLLQRP